MPAKKKTKPKKSHKADKVMKHVGEQMRKWRTVSEKSLETVGDEIGCTKGHLSSVENGQGNLSVRLLLRFCEAVEAPVSKVLEERLLAKHRDVDRLTAQLVEKAGSVDIRWLAELDKSDLKVALKAAHDAIDAASYRDLVRDDAEHHTG